MCKREESYYQNVDKNYYFNKRLKFLGIETKYTAFYFLSDIMQKLINEQIRVHSFSRQVYPSLAKKYNKQDSAIERNIRNLITLKWEETLKCKLTKYWCKTTKPSCCQFIRIIKTYLSEQIA